MGADGNGARPAQAMLENLGANGTLVNDLLVGKDTAVALQDGDRISISARQFRFQYHVRPQSASAIKLPPWLTPVLPCAQACCQPTGCHDNGQVSCSHPKGRTRRARARFDHPAGPFAWRPPAPPRALFLARHRAHRSRLRPTAHDAFGPQRDFGAVVRAAVHRDAPSLRRSSVPNLRRSSASTPPPLPPSLRRPRAKRRQPPPWRRW